MFNFILFSVIIHDVFLQHSVTEKRSSQSVNLNIERTCFIQRQLSDDHRFIPRVANTSSTQLKKLTKLQT